MPYSDRRQPCFRANAKKRTQFKTGCLPPNYGRQRAQRADEPEVTGTGKCQTARLTDTEARDVTHLTDTDSDQTLLQYRLRPTSEREKRASENQALDENLIVNIDRLTELISHVHQVSCKFSKLRLNIEKRVGLCIFASLHCGVCKYKSPTMPLSDVVDKSQHTPGPPSGALNSQLVLPVLKSKVGIEDVIGVMTCLNIKPPSSRTLQSKFNEMARAATQLNEAQMLVNQQYVQHVTELATGESFADVQFDVSYSSRPQGGCEKAKQSFGALVEHSTTRKLPLAIAVANKHCRIPGCAHVNCSKNYPHEKTIASSERTLIQESLKKVENSPVNLPLRSITTDGSTQEAKAIRDFYANKEKIPRHDKCYIHKLKTMEKNVNKLELKSIPTTVDNKRFYKKKLSSAVRQRVRKELDNIRGKSNFVEVGAAAVNNITDCFSGDHRKCQQLSSVCIAHREHYTANHLPYDRHLQLDKTDLKRLQEQINAYFGENGLGEMSDLFNTNMCESMNSSVYNYAPKTTRYTRNFAGLCHSAVHSRTLGKGKSTETLAQAAGVKVSSNSAMKKGLLSIDSRQKYHARRQASHPYKQSRYFMRERQSNARVFANSLYSTENLDSTSASEHNYGVNY